MALTLATLAVTPTAAGAQENPFERGPDPTATSVLANRGNYAISSATVSGLGVTGFGGGTIYYPTSQADGTFGAVVIAPGFTAGSGSYLSLAQRVASHGFVTFAIDTNSRFDFPDSRGRQILAAVDYLTQQSTVRSRIDASRVAVSGHSMGGGGTLAAANSRSSLQAAVALQPWHTTKSWGNLRVPTMIIGAQADTIAPVGSHSQLFYQSIPASTEKAYAELAGASHFAGNSNPDWQGRSMVVWLKRYVDDDTRYEQFMCPAPRAAQLSEYRDTCPG
ncbi:MAG TPA: alpha/beta hydrolase [Acidimicrobiales bacterium]|nr:alpha/beta hydrolase [Acidimicrobiales bacterium]